MSKRSTQIEKAPDAEPAPAATETAAAQGDEELSRADHATLATVLHFLVAMQRPGLAAIAQAHGYNGKEHAHGWRLHRAASGEAQALAVVFTRATPAPTMGDSHMPTLRQIDAFENLWFPRTRAIIQRVVPEASRDRFEAAFFHELTQQPLGPGVVGSVSTYLTRLEALKKSPEPGAREVRDTLRTRGLTDAAVSQMSALVASMRELVPVAPAPAIDAVALSKARAEQKRAVAALRAWYNDWATTLRTVYNRKQLIQLGLASATRKASSEGDEPDAPVA